MTHKIGRMASGKKSLWTTQALATLAIAAWAWSPASAQPLLTLDEAIRLSLRNNYSLSLSQDQAAVAAVNLEGGRGNFLPSASAALSNSGKLDGTGSETTVEASANWVVFNGFQNVHAYQQLESLDRSARLDERAALEGLMESVMNAYYDIVQQKQRLASIHDLLSVSEERGKLASAKLEIGAGSRLDQLQSVADLNEDSSSFLTQGVSLRKAKVKLNQLMAREPSLDFQVADSIPLEGSQPLDDWRKALLENNSTLAAARARRDAAISGIGVARANWFPTLNTGVTYASSPAALNSNAAARNGGVTYRVDLSVPIFDKFATPTGVRRAKLGLHQEETRVKQAESDAVGEFEQVRSQFESGLRQSALEERNLQVAKLQEEGALERYRAGASSSLEFRTAQQRLLDAEVRLITARQSAKQAEVALRRLSGLLVRQAPSPQSQVEGK